MRQSHTYSTHLHKNKDHCQPARSPNTAVFRCSLRGRFQCTVNSAVRGRYRESVLQQLKKRVRSSDSSGGLGGLGWRSSGSGGSSPHGEALMWCGGTPRLPGGQLRCLRPAPLLEASRPQSSPAFRISSPFSMVLPLLNAVCRVSHWF